MTTYVQDLRSSRNKLVNGRTRIGHIGRLWYDPSTNTIRVGDGTPGGRLLSLTDFISMGDTPNSYDGMADKFVKVNDTCSGLTFSDIVDGGNF